MAGIPLAAFALWAMRSVRAWRTHRLTVDVARKKAEKVASGYPEEGRTREQKTAGRPSKPVRRVEGLRGWLLRQVYPFYRKN
ncbi:MAG: hypothetical protein V5A23_02275 [Halobacteriales archaeon]